jgi:hypothetical protein
MIVTTNPNLLSSDTGKIMVKYEMTYNKDVETELTISNFKELGIILENQLQNA